MRFSRYVQLDQVCRTLLEAVDYIQGHDDSDLCQELLDNGTQMLQEFYAVLMQYRSDWKNTKTKDLLDEINCILNLRDAWNYVLTNIDSKINLEFICKVNSYVSRNESLEWGVLRNGKVGINGVDYIPDIPIKEEVVNNINKILEEKNITKKAIDLMLYLMRSQIFWDGNKRTSMIIANKILIESGCGVITVKEENINEFNKLLTEYYNTNNKNKIVEFLYKNCIFGLEIN